MSIEGLKPTGNEGNNSIGNYITAAVSALGGAIAVLEHQPEPAGFLFILALLLTAYASSQQR